MDRSDEDPGELAALNSPKHSGDAFDTQDILQSLNGGHDDQYRAMVAAAPQHDPSIQERGYNHQPSKGLNSMAALSGLDAPPSMLAKTQPKVQIRPSEGFKPLSGLADNVMQIEKRAQSGVQPLPSHYQINTSVISTEKPECILQGLEESITEFGQSEKNDVQFKTNQTNHKIRGSVFIDDRLVVFHIHLFDTGAHHPKANHILIEFQRREGCGFAFQKFYRGICRTLETKKLIQYGAHPADDSLPQPMGSLELGLGGLKFANDESLPRNLVKMCGSVYLEPRREATGVLATGSRSKENIDLMVNKLDIGASLLTALCNLIRTCHDMEVTRNSAVVLMNLFEHAEKTKAFALENQLFSELCAAILKWSGAEQGVASSTLVSQALFNATFLLASDLAGSRQSVDKAARDCLEKVRKESPEKECKAIAENLLGVLTM